MPNMRRRILFSILVFLILFPLLVFIVSFTPFFNNQVRSILISLVNRGTNASLYLGEIHGSILGSFSIDGAALMYGNEPIALVDTIKVSHFPLSLVAKTVDAIHVELVHPRFHLTKFKDGSLNVDHISKSRSTSGGQFDWTIVLKSLTLRNGQFSYYDSTVAPNDEIDPQAHDRKSGPFFDPAHFTASKIFMSADANINGRNLTVNIVDLSLKVDPADFVVDSLRFGFFTSPGGTEVSGLVLKSGSTSVRADVTLMEQSLLDPIGVESFKTKQLSASLDAKKVRLGDVEKFIHLPLDPPSTANLSFYVSGSLDTLNVKQFLLSTDSSRVPLNADFFNLVDTSFSAKIQTRNASVNVGEIHSLLRSAGFPDMKMLKQILVSADVSTNSKVMKARISLDAGTSEVVGNATLQDGNYDGDLRFSGINLANILNQAGAQSRLDGEATFDLQSGGSGIPHGKFAITCDSSEYDDTFVRKSSINVSSLGDSVKVRLNLLSSNGNIDGDALLNTRTESYDGKFAFSELNVAPFARQSQPVSNLTGTLEISGDGLSLDSSQTRVYLLTENSVIGNLALNDAAFTLSLNTEKPIKTFQLRSPFVDADISGDFVPLQLPSQLSNIFSRLADSLSGRLLAKHDSTTEELSDIKSVSASVDLKVKDARLINQFLPHAQVSGNPSVHLMLAYGPQTFFLSGSASADSLFYSQDSTTVNGTGLGIQFDMKTDDRFSVWDHGRWTIDGNIQALRINQTELAAKIIKASYTSGDSTGSDGLNFTLLGRVEPLVDFYVDGSGRVAGDSISITTRSLLGKLYGFSLVTHDPVQVTYLPETFHIHPLTFWTDVEGAQHGNDTRLTLAGEYSFDSGADLHIRFYNIGLRPLQRLARLDTTSLALGGSLSGSADITESQKGINISSDFTGDGVVYNGTKAKTFGGSFALEGDEMSLNAQLSKEADSSRDALKVQGVIPLSAKSESGLQLSFTADSLNISFLAPFLSGVQDFRGFVSGDLALGGNYRSPTFQGTMQINNGKIRLAANDINYEFDGSLEGNGDRILLKPVTLRNLPSEGGETMVANGFLRIADNTIKELSVDLSGSLLVLNNAAQNITSGISGVAVVGSGSRGLQLGGSLAKLRLEGTMNIQSADLKLVGIQKTEGAYVQEIVYHFPAFPSEQKSASKVQQPQADVTSTSSSVLDSLRYDLEIETKDNVSLRLIFNSTTNEELYAVLGGRLHLSNSTGAMVLNGEVSVQTNSYYTFYKQFAATGKLSFTGDPLNPSLDITAQYQGEHADTSATHAPETVVVLLKITGTFNSPSVAISMTVGNNPYVGDAQTNAISFIVFGQFEDELTSTTRRSAADNLMSQAGAGMLTAGTSVLSGVLTSLLGKELKFIQSVSLRYPSVSNVADPDLSITGKIGPAIIRLGGQVFSDINNTDVSVDYPLTELLGNKIYIEASRKVSLNNRSYYQRETINMLKVFYQLSF